MSEVLQFLAGFEDGASEEQICEKLPNLSKVELASILNGLLSSNQVELVNHDGKLFYKAIQNRAADYEAMVVLLLRQSGANGAWLREIQQKTNIPRNLILKILRNLEAGRKIKAVKSVKNNRKVYVLYDVQPDEEITGGVWFNDSDVDLIFVNKLMDVIYQYCLRKEESYALPKISSLARLSDLKLFIAESKISGVELTMDDISTLVDCLVCDGRMEKHPTADGIALRSLRASQQ